MAKRNYQNKFPSVTTALAVLRKIALEIWFKINTAQFCDAESRLGRKTGTEIHAAIEQYIREGTAKIVSENAGEVTTALNSFMLFRKEHPEIELTLSEIALTSEKYKYNGTIDAPNPPILYDWKSGKCKDKDKPPIYDEAKTQVSAYVKLWNENNPEQLINKAFIVALAKDKVAYNFYEMGEEEINDNFNEVFLPALQICNYQQKHKKERKNQ